ncbi:MAG: hypothetical protein KBG15_06665 [Kofleriaceae bacterium]|nr:hypothetical protein [Kofleriaceae bacterium]
MRRNLVTVSFVALAIWSGSGCYAAAAPQLTVLGVQPSARPKHQVVFVQITNRVGRPLRVQRLDYTFAASRTMSPAWKPQVGELLVARDIPAGSTVVLEVPLDGGNDTPLTLSGNLITQRDQIVTSYPIRAQFQPAAQ